LARLTGKLHLRTKAPATSGTVWSKEDNVTEGGSSSGMFKQTGIIKSTGPDGECTTSAEGAG